MRGWGKGVSETKKMKEKEGKKKERFLAPYWFSVSKKKGVFTPDSSPSH